MGLYLGVMLLTAELAETLQEWGSTCISLSNMKTVALFANCQHTNVVQGDEPLGVPGTDSLTLPALCRQQDGRVAALLLMLGFGCLGLD